MTRKLSTEKLEGISNFLQLLKVCTKKQDLNEGIGLHADIVKRGLLQENTCLVNALINMYAKCGAIANAHQIHDDIAVRDVASWNALISGYVRQGKCHEALNCFRCMQDEGLSPDAITFSCILKACGYIGAIEKGEKVHNEIVRRCKLKGNIVLGTALVDMYAKCGNLLKAKEVHDNLNLQDTVSWNVLVSSYSQQEKCQQAFDCFEQMKCMGISPDAVTFVSILKACSSTQAINKGKIVHTEIINRGLIDENTMLGNALVDMYAKCGLIANAQQVFDDLSVRNKGSWNALIAGLTQKQKDYEALDCFERMKDEGLSPDEITFSCILKACGNIGDIDKGKQIHDEILGRNLLQQHTSIGSALVDMYAKCGSLTRAQQVHDELHARSTISWNTLIAGYAYQGQGNKALECFEHMKRDGISPDVVTYTSVLNACGVLRAVQEGKQIHEQIVDQDLLQKDVVLGVAVVNMYAKCGLLATARKVHDDLPTRNLVSWSALIAGFSQHGFGHEALNCLEQMQNDGVCPNAIIFTCALKSCGIVGSIDKGMEIHNEIVCKGWLEKDVTLGNALVVMYAKCDALPVARDLLDEFHIRDVVSWNTVIGGYAEKGFVHEALTCYEQMESEGLIPVPVTFVCLLNACSLSGLWAKAETYFETMTKKYRITPHVEHYTCMIIVYGYAGNLEKAMLVIKRMPCYACSTVWLALLSACRKWENVRLARLAFDWVVQLDENCGAAYVLMSNIYAAVNMPEDAERVETIRQKYNGQKNPSLTEHMKRPVGVCINKFICKG